jgi:hypothetical protein
MKTTVRVLTFLISFIFVINCRSQIFIETPVVNMDYTPLCRWGKISLGTANVLSSVFDPQFEVFSTTPVGTTGGDNSLVASLIGNCQMGIYNSPGNLKSNTWLLRDYSDNTWNSVSFHEGISLDGQYNTPGIDTKTWWQRNPSLGVQSWGNDNVVSMKLFPGKLVVNQPNANGWASANLDVFNSNGNYPAFQATAIHNSDYGYAANFRVARDWTKAIGVTQLMYGNTTTANTKETFVVFGDGTTRIGPKRISSTHPHSDAFVQIDGKVACKELVVIDPAQWADFVFEPSYKPMPLMELETFYTSHHHLPEVPTETDVKSNGINTAEMDALLLKKIEELTLYIVDLNKKLAELEKKQSNH